MSSSRHVVALAKKKSSVKKSSRKPAKAAAKKKTSGKSAASPAKKKSGKATAPIWIGFLHPTGLEPAQEDSFLTALGASYACDPLEPVGTRPVAYIRWVHARGHYAKGNVANLKRAVTNLVGTPGGLSLLITGSSIAAKAADAVVPNTLPVLAVIGRQGLPLNNSFGGFYLSDQTNQDLQQKITILATDYGVGTAANPDVSKMCLLYNGNSEMSTAELAAWNTVTGGQGKSVDASGGSDNPRMNLKQAFQAADALVGDGGGIIVSSDPFFSNRRSRIIRLGAKSNQMMCYPLQEYFADAQEASDPGTFFTYGPSLADVYAKIGTAAAQVLLGNPLAALAPATLTYQQG